MIVKYSPVCCRTRSSKSGKLTYALIRSFLIYILLTLSVILVASLYLSGLWAYLFEEDYLNFRCPQEISDIRGLVERIDQIETRELDLTSQSGNVVIRPIDYNAIADAVDSIRKDGDISSKIVPLDQWSKLDFLLDPKPTCAQQWNFTRSFIANQTQTQTQTSHGFVSLLIIVKSAVNNLVRRNAIRNSWYLNQTIGLYNFKTVFIVGKCDHKNPIPASILEHSHKQTWTIEDCQRSIISESAQYGDIVQSSGIDSYYNNTIKTFMTLRWLSERCSSDFSLALDDDYVFEVENFIQYLETKAWEYAPKSLNEYYSRDSNDKIDTPNSYQPGNNSDPMRMIEGLKRLSRQYVWAGYLKNHVHPLRSVMSKWYVSIDDYPYNKYPPFITGGAIFMSNKTARHLYYAAYFTRLFKFDDVYIGIIALRLGIKPDHSDYFMCHIDEYIHSQPIRPNSTECMAVHEIEPKKLVALWKLRRQIAKGEQFEEAALESVIS